ncbi:hypothetical protein OAO52_05625 [Flavobacteriaceae bacterium]|jgi:hypothetical protein|nr:hypothetical protein [Flavobacteriaceae bacterium]
MKVKFTSLSWLHSEKEEDILFWNLEVKLTIDNKPYELNVYFEEYYESGSGIGSGFLISDFDLVTLHHGLWEERTREKNVEKEQNPWMVGEFKGIDVWNEIEDFVYEWNGFGFWSEERVISEETLKSLDIKIQL